MPQPEPPTPRLGDFSEVFRVFSVTDSPRRQDEGTRRPDPLPARPPKTERPASRPVVAAAAAATVYAARHRPADSIGFLSGIERFLSPQPLPDEDGSTSTSSASEPDEASDDASAEPAVAAATTTPAVVHHHRRRQHHRAASPVVAIVSASTSPATAAATPATGPSSPVKRSSLIPKTAARRLARTVSPPSSSPPPPPPPLIGNVIVPLRAQTRAAKLARIDVRLASEQRAYAAAHGPWQAAPTPAVHVFVDLSNIAIGFINRLRTERGVPAERRVQEPPLFFGGLARILERGRQVTRRVTAGSVRTVPFASDGFLLDSDNDNDNNNNEDRRAWHAYMVEAADLGYEMNLLRRVARSAAHGEQAVDEVLQLKMCHSVLDAEPGTLVLATGDGAAAEFSDGFLRHVQRALARDWCVELVAWKQGIAAAWRTLAREHRGRFRIVELDAFVHELHGVFAEGGV